MFSKDWWVKFGYKFTWFSKLWYEFTMAVSRDKQYRLPVYENVEDIPKAFDFGSKYRFDTILERESDHLTHPSTLQKRLEEGKARFGDCDDHAIYWCTALLKSKLAKKVWFAFYAMKAEDNTHYSAHAVCVFQGLDDNIYWADYTNPRKIEEVKDFMKDSAKRYKRVPIAGAIWHVKGIKRNDTPVFGKITRLLPGE